MSFEVGEVLVIRKADFVLRWGELHTKCFVNLRKCNMKILCCLQFFYLCEIFVVQEILKRLLCDRSQCEENVSWSFFEPLLNQNFLSTLHSIYVVFSNRKQYHPPLFCSKTVSEHWSWLLLGDSCPSLSSNKRHSRTWIGKPFIQGVFFNVPPNFQYKDEK